MNSRYLQTIFLILFLSSCLADLQRQEQTGMLFERPGFQFNYAVDKPGRSWKMPHSLVEISGIGWVDPRTLACIQDEKGSIYLLNLDSGKVESRIDFGSRGDYEDIEIIGQDAWVLKSNGTLYHVINFRDDSSPQVEKFATALKRSNDTEGLACDSLNGKLLIACKQLPYIEEPGQENVRAIYSFDLETRVLDEEPALLIHLDTLERYISGPPASKAGKGWKDSLNPAEKTIDFMPSGIAIHPITGNTYVLASVGKLLLVYSASGQLLSMAALDPKLFTQPEGICFSPEGTMYISNEGAGRKATVLEFTPIN